MMKQDFVQVDGTKLSVNGNHLLLRGYGLGSWMNLEHFMIGLPGTDSMIKRTFTEVYGADRCDQFYDRFLMEFVDDRDFEYLKGLGVNLLRIPFNYRYFLDDQNPHSYKEDGFKYLDHVVSLCEKYQIYAVLDLHATPGGQNPDWHCDTRSGIPMLWEYGVFRDSVIGLWKHIAAHYRDQPWIAGYDLINEPSMVPDAAVFNEFYRNVVSAIREVDPDHVIFIEGNRFSTDFSMVEAVDDPQVAYTFHFYPFVDNPDVLSPEMKRETRKRLIAETFGQLVSIREKYQKPVWCGEFGLDLNPDGIELQAEIIEDMLELCQQHDVSWALWAYKDAASMGIVFPNTDTPWRKLTAKIREGWNQHKEQEIGEALVDYMAETYFKPIDKQLQYKLQFRMRTIMQEICVEQHLKPYLQELAWEDAIQLPESFHFDRCSQWDQLSNLLRSILLK